MAQIKEVLFLQLLLSRQFQFSEDDHKERQLGHKKEILILNFSTFFWQLRKEPTLMKTLLIHSSNFKSYSKSFPTSELQMCRRLSAELCAQELDGGRQAWEADLSLIKDIWAVCWARRCFEVPWATLWAWSLEWDDASWLVNQGKSLQNKRDTDVDETGQARRWRQTKQQLAAVRQSHKYTGGKTNLWRVSKPKIFGFSWARAATKQHVCLGVKLNSSICWEKGVLPARLPAALLTLHIHCHQTRQVNTCHS